MEADAMVGKRFGLLKVVRRLPQNKLVNASYYAVVDAECDCGRHIRCLARDVRSGEVETCGKCDLVPPPRPNPEDIAEEARKRLERKQKRLQEIEQKRIVATEKRMKLESQRERKKQERIDRLNRQLAAAKAVNGGESK